MDISEKLVNKINLKTKPLGALGRLEKLAQQIGTIQNTLSPELKKPTILTFAGDHGIAKEGVSAYPQEVTYQMVINFLQGGAAINVFCRQNNIDLKVIDSGVNADFAKDPILINAKIAKGTKNFLTDSAMTKSQLDDCFNKATMIINQIHQNGCNIIGFGEMGIGNTSSATMLMSTLCNLPVQKCTGRGTGLNDKQYQNKIQVLEKAKEFHRNDANTPQKALQTYGGFEIAQICAGMLAAYKNNMIIMVDGFITSCAFLVACKMNPKILDNAIFCHLSKEQGHKLLIECLNVDPLLKLDMRLGEGTGCAVVYPIIQSAVTFLNDMASFQSAGVTNKK